MNKASMGRIVSAVGFRSSGNGTDLCPAILTRVWSEEDGVALVNATLFPDCGSPQNVTSVKLYPSQEDARASLQNETMTALFWPSRD